MPCGHYLHKECYNQYMETAYKCPTCKKSAVNMELQWQKLTQAIESQPMPEQFADTRAVIQCNDCSAKSSVKYNTNELRIINGPESEQTANALLQVDSDAFSGARSPVSVSSPASQPLRSPRYYFQPDEPEQTWLPGQLPSFPFQMPQMRMPQFPGMPQLPQFSGMPQLPQFYGMPHLPPFPQMPQMPDPYELLERVQKSFDYYLNPTGEIPNENVPIIDLDVEDEHRQLLATDGTTVQLPSLPQYVLERFNQSLTPLRNYLNSPTEQIPDLDLAGEHDGMHPWGADSGRRVNRSPSEAEEDDEGEDDDSSSEESAEEEEEDDEDVEEDENEFELPGHR
jgi:DNA-directed RNA polymerase subunit RPC12/RpoP